MNKPRTGKMLNCLGCSKECYVPTYRLNTFRWCSIDCKNKFGCTEKIKESCAVCGNEFEHISSRANKAKYCSRKCYYKSQISLDRGNAEYTCAHCGIIFKDSPCKDRKFCSRACVNKTKKETYIPVFTTARKWMIRLNMFKECEICGYKEIKEILGVHHKDKNRKNNRQENLMIVCPNCHSILHMKHIPHSPEG